MHDEFIENETWYFLEVNGDAIKKRYPNVDEESLDFISSKLAGLHIMNLTSPFEDIAESFEEIFTVEKSNTKVARKVHKGSIIREDKDTILVLKRDNRLF